MSDTESNPEIKEEGPSIGTYEGARNDAKQRHGQGKTTFPNGDTYEGSYSNGSRNGQGTYRWKNGARYSGNYKDDLRDGNGLFVYPDGSKYKGEFKAGKRHGTGVYVYANGDAYQGQWEDDTKHGQGTYTYQSTGSQKKGLWDHNNLTGPGEIIHADHKISGRFVDNSRMDMPVKLTFLKTGWVKEVNDPSLVAMTGAGDVAVAE
ncbi:Radial spoke head 1 [Rhizophlyctis rosea]|uniref:Radial spoke head 1 n=1 Tax=Rhizophlyctis rosea TaxID=64517 RepID=A0AAD5S1Y2_9FUNG|nr:Radial spoke head 1 [Rhizophlyctis rosea]